MPRLLFEKTGSAVWISHLDLMRLFQRAFKRAGLALTHSNGFNPRPQVSIALPLSVGVSSRCELLDFSLDSQEFSMDEIRERLNRALVAGITVRDVYEDGRKVRDLALTECTLRLEYDRGYGPDVPEQLRALFARESLPVEKRSKNGIQDQDMIPMIRRMEVTAPDDHTISLHVLIHCQNPALNPAQFTAAISRYLPECVPDFSTISRMEVYDTDETVFR